MSDVPPASADAGPHVAGADPVADSCAGCHRAHTAQGVDLLKEDAQTALCYTCHGTSGTGANTDVQDGVGYTIAGRGGAPEALRGGGFEYALIDSADPSGQTNAYWNPRGTVPVKETGAPVTSTHSIDSSDQMAWGNGDIDPDPDYGSTIQLSCASCHDPHGGAGQDYAPTYRALEPIPGDSQATEGVEIVDIDESACRLCHDEGDTAAKLYKTTNYWDVEHPYAPEFIEKISSWCSTCHTRYLARMSSGDQDSGDAVFKYRHRSNQDEQGEATCIQCHVAHGSNATMSGEASEVNWPDGTPAGTDSRLLRIDNRGICQMCHNR